MIRMYYEREHGFTHCEAAHGSDYTLCGFTLDGDQGPIEEVKGLIDCPACLGVIQFCKKLRPKLLGPQVRLQRERASKRSNEKG